MTSRPKAPYPRQRVLVRTWCALLSLTVSQLACSPSSKPPTPPGPRAPDPPTTSTPSVSDNGRIFVELLEGPTPWTHLEAQNDAQAFQFAIVSDRTGGMRPGVFASAISKLNLLNPEFVVSVGDLIEGYTENLDQLKTEWDEFDGIVDDLRAPFFYLPGNHDITNETMRQVWHERYGPSHYYFLYRDVLFLCLDTNDGGVHQVSDAQIAWLGQVLKQHTNVRWTLLFLHNPLWDDQATYDGPQRDISTWERIEPLLADRRYTAFAGHYHTYVQRIRNDRKHFTLATTGGGSSLRGPHFGEFDHVMWVTMTPDGPLIANLMLDGIWDENIRTGELRKFQTSLFEGDTLKPSPLFFEHTFRAGESQLRINNRRDTPLHITLTPGHLENLQLQPPGPLELEVPPNSVHDQPFQLRATPNLRTTTTLPLHWRASTHDPNGTQIEFTGQSHFTLIHTQRIPHQGPILVDGTLQEWGRLPFSIEQPSQILKQPTAWRNRDDNRFSVGIRADEQHLYLAIDVTDDQVNAQRTLPPWEQDGLEIRIDARPEPARSHYAPAHDGRDILLLPITPSDSADDPWLYQAGWIQQVPGIRIACIKTPHGYTAEVAIPRTWLTQQKNQDQRIRLNLTVNDQDDDGQSQSWWWPAWHTPEHLPGSGTYQLP